MDPTQTGSIPLPMDRSHLRPSSALKSLALPSYFSWDDSNVVTVAKDQMNFGTCWSFAACGDLESKVLMREDVEYNFSELNLVACNPHSLGGYTGGNAMVATNYLSVLGTVLEICDPYPDGLPNPTCDNPACDFYKTVTEWRFVPDNVTAIKNAIYTLGPVQARVHADSEWDTYSGLYCIAQPDSDANHNVLLIGWDDDLCGAGVGGWLIKNSYGPLWGLSGMGFVEYNHGAIESEVTAFTDYKDYDPNETVYYWDEYGWRDQAGYGDGSDMALVEIAPTADGWLWAINLWATTSPLDYTVSIYDGFRSGVPTDLLRNPFSGSVDAAGFYTVELPHLLPVTNGDPVYVVVSFDGYGYPYVVPFDDWAGMDTSKSYISDTGASWEAFDGGGVGYGDIGIRARVTTSAFEKGDPSFYGGMGADLIEADAGDTVTLHPRPLNMGSVCVGEDTFCVHVVDTQGWTVWGDLETPVYLPPYFYDILDLFVEVPLSVPDNTKDTVIAYLSYWEDGACREERGDCEDPVWVGESACYSADTVIISAAGCVAVPEGGRAPARFELAQNHPNPFNPYTEIRYNLPEDCRVLLIVYNVQGQKVATLVDGDEKAGYKSIRWDGRDRDGRPVSSGIYLYRLIAGGFTSTKKMVLAK